MSDGPALLAAILAQPEDDTPRLVYADWLDEQGEAERGEFIRVQVAIAAMDEAGEGEIDPNDGHTCCDDPCPVCASVERYTGLRRRKQELFENGRTYKWGFPKAIHCTPFADTFAKGLGPETAIGLSRRGFVSEVRCTLAAWVAHGPAIVRAHPVERVVLSDRESTIRGTDRTHMWVRESGMDNAPRDELPNDLFDHLPVMGQVYYFVFNQPGDWRSYPTESDANDALSFACRSWAKSRLADAASASA